MKSALELFAAQFTPPEKFAGGRFCIPSLTGSSDAFLSLVTTGALHGDPRLVLAVTPGIPDAERLADDLNVLIAESIKSCPRSASIRIIEFPPLTAGDIRSIGERLKAIAAIRAWSVNPYHCVVIASFPSFATPIPLGEVQTITIPGPDFSTLISKLAAHGYNRSAQVTSEGQYSVRGGIVDAWSPGEEFPIRMEFFGDELESVRKFDPASQTSIARISSTSLLPASSECVSNTPASASLLDLLPDNSTVILFEHNEYALPIPERPAAGKQFKVIFTGDPAPPNTPTYAFQTVPLPGFTELGADNAHHPELFDAARRRLEQHLDASAARGVGVFKIDDLTGGFEVGRLAVVAKSDRVFTRKHLRRHVRPAAQGERINDFDDLVAGEYVVHVDYGIGRYVGRSEIDTGNGQSEVFTIEYADGGKLHVPAAHAHLLTRYVGVRGATVRLHRLDGSRWKKDREDAQRSVCDLAATLLETQAKRETAPGFAYNTECDGIDAFELSFPFEETPDQLAAISAVKHDLAAQKPMDRLICGDAGYGKTEVAMRAAYIAAMNGKQVAVLAPTTVLAEQHFETFTSRFDGTPVRIESVSRFQSAATHQGTFKRIATGVCDIVIGTHAILSKKIAFHDLGLIIIDEEQRFGVRHKEFLKRLRATADVLTLSATPIPRTLYLSMTGARDLSLLRSPPRERVAVDIKVVTDSDMMIQAAIEAELARGGQVFFLHNRVATISKVEKRLTGIFSACKCKPRIVTAHGQMDAAVLARKMRDFQNGKYDILLSTTIIESGVDIPRANTIIVDHAEMFGLADLYQLRGRVGRSSRQGYAMFLLPAGGIIDSDARERLSALKRHGGLGSGFNLAMRDLELRGAGNLLGTQQSGHIAAIGFTLYCQLLQRTVAKMKGEKVHNIVNVQLNLDFISLSPNSDDTSSAAAIPYSYIEDDAQRLSFMRRFGSIADIASIRALTNELADRFGPLPPQVKRMLSLSELRIHCANASISVVDVQNNRAVFHRNGTNEVSAVVDLRGKTADRKISELKSYVKDGLKR